MCDGIMYENGKKYVRVYSGSIKSGDEYMGNKSKSSSNGPDEWVDVGTEDSIDIRCYDTLIFRRPVENTNKEEIKSDLIEEAKENDMKGYRLLEVGEALRDGDQVKYCGSWRDVVCSTGETVQEDNEENQGRMPYGYYRRKIESDVSQQSKDSEPPIKSYSIEDLMKWRNTASKRISKIDDDLKYIDLVIKEYTTNRRRLLKKRSKDCAWVSRCNNALYQKVIKERN